MSELSNARAVAAERRAALMATARELQTQLAPKTLAGNAVESAKRKGEEMAEDAVHALRKRPAAVSAVVAGATALVSFNLFRRFRKGAARGDEE